MGYDYEELFPGRFLKAVEFKGRDVTLKIARVEIEELPDEKGTPNKEGVRVKVRGIISFERTKKQLCLNRTNGEMLKALFGRKTDDWIGKRVTFFPAQVESFGETVPAIRVRGSPEIEKPIEFEARIGRQQRKFRLMPTGAKPATNGNAAKSAAAPPPVAAPAADDAGDGLPDDEQLDAERDEFNQGFQA